VRKPKPARRDAPAAVAGLRSGSAARKDEPQQADSAEPKPKAGEQQAEAAKPKPKAKGEQQADASTPPASNGGLINGAQPMIPSGSFDSRWQGLR
jgi:hypothetical protein